MKKTFHTLISLFLFLSLASFTFSCSRSPLQEELDFAETRMETRPDSALSILKGIDKSALNSNKDRARYALLMSMALDKNYIDTTSLDILQPAIDYYLEKGTPDEKLRTYYYQGVICLNRGEDDNALSSFINGIDYSKGFTDSLSMARNYVAQGILYKKSYNFESYIDCYLKGASLYREKQNQELEFDCLLNALNGTIIISNKERSDSIMNRLNQMKFANSEQKKLLEDYKFSYSLKFKSDDDLRKIISLYNPDSIHTSNGILNLAIAYNKLNDNEKAKQFLDYLDKNNVERDTLKYQYIYSSVLCALGNYKDAYSLYHAFNLRLDSINAYKFHQKSKFIEDKHKIEYNAQQDAMKKTRIIWVCVACIVFFAMLALVLWLLAKNNKNKKNLAFQKVKLTQLENEKLRTERECLSLENKNLQLERDNNALAADNLSRKVEILEAEIISLKKILETPAAIPAEVEKTIQTRINMLNSLLAQYITNNSKYGQSYDSWVKELTEDTETFMNSNRLSFQASHPRFIQYLEEQELTPKEINYVCLYAIGLRGKEVGNYIKMRSHMNISSAIRRKLGLDSHNTNLGIYVRKLLNEL